MTVQIDGSHGEGGGQILRTALALAAILRRPVEVNNIRGGRKRPGLGPQHLMAVRALGQITSANTRGAELRSRHLFFEPRHIKPGRYTFDVGTAGSTSLVLQAVIPGLLIAKGPSQVTVTGGTHVPWSPCFHYLREVFSPSVQEMGAVVGLKIERWGWYPKGGGKIIASVLPAEGFKVVRRTARGKLLGIRVLSALSNLPLSIGERQRDRVLKRLTAEGYDMWQMELVEAPSPGTGTVAFIRGQFESGAVGFTSLGKRGKPAEKVADEACSHFLEFMATEAAVDTHLADQLVLYMALAEGRSTLITGAITTHLLTNIWVIEKFLPVQFDIDHKTGRVSVEGVGFLAHS
jgi:RNA 3'-terminal phosphate cyclase (ATP)